MFGMWLIVVLCGLYFLFPLWALAKFTLDLPLEGWTLKAYTQALKVPELHATLWLSAQIAFFTIVVSLALMLWTVLWANLKVRRLQPVVEFISILPYMVPPIAFVVGIAGVFRPTFPSFIASPWCLVFFYTVLAMPFTYRSLDAGLKAIDVKTLTEASRGLGAGWFFTITRVVVPNLRSALLGSTFLTIAVVLGEFTIASLLLINTFPIFIYKEYQQEIFAGPALGLMSMLFVALLFVLLGLLTRKRGVANATAAIV
jgi:putative spermidine/putrescine transport system permease protein